MRLFQNLFTERGSEMKKFIFLTVLLTMFSAYPAGAQTQKPILTKNVSLTVKVAIVQDNKETESDEYSFLLNDGQSGNYENSSTIPYWPKKENAEVNFIEEKIKISLKPTLQDDLSIVESHVEGCINTQNSIRNDVSVPNISCYSHSGSSVLQGDQYTEIFDGKLGSEKTRRLKIFIKGHLK